MDISAVKLIIITLLLLVFPMTLRATEADKDILLDIHQICTSSPSQCLLEIGGKLRSVPFKSRVWFQYKLYQFDALFRLVKLKDLKTEIVKWIVQEEVPLRFKINIYILYAKIIKPEGNHALVEQYLNKAINILSSVNDVTVDPMIIVQIANALNYLNKNQQGYDMLVTLEKKYFKRNNVMFKLELYENLGHFSYRLGKLEEHILLREKAMHWAKQHGNTQRIATAIYNLARAYQMTKEYTQALDYFDQAERYAQRSANYFTLSMSKFRRSEIEHNRGNNRKAREYFHLIDKKALPESSDEMLNALANKIK